MTQYPKLPKCQYSYSFGEVQLFTAEQMHAYADAVRAQVIEESARELEHIGRGCDQLDLTTPAIMRYAASRVRALAHQNKEGV